MNEFLKFLFLLLGTALIWIAVDYKRKDDSKFEFLSKDNIIQFILVIIGCCILVTYGRL